LFGSPPASILIRSTSDRVSWFSVLDARPLHRGWIAYQEPRADERGLQKHFRPAFASSFRSGDYFPARKTSTSIARAGRRLGFLGASAGITCNNLTGPLRQKTRSVRGPPTYANGRDLTKVARPNWTSGPRDSVVYRKVPRRAATPL
jgi:hypothetical protein